MGNSETAHHPTVRPSRDREGNRSHTQANPFDRSDFQVNSVAEIRPRHGHLISPCMLSTQAGSVP